MPLRQPLTGLAVQRAADAERTILVDRITDQVVAERQLEAIVLDDM